MSVYPKRDLVVELPDGTRRHVFADQPIPSDLLEHVPAKDRKKASERDAVKETGVA